ncbi:MAG TPA: hypothetical protein ENO09_07750 [bacterium]|nr:hypothetical protein [bacterium]
MIEPVIGAAGLSRRGSVRRLLGLRDMVSFHADNVPDLLAACVEAVDDYLDTRENLSKGFAGKSPQKSPLVKAG